MMREKGSDNGEMDRVDGGVHGGGQYVSLSLSISLVMVV